MNTKEEERPTLKHLNEHIVCPLCRGYLIDATTLVECLHSFCRGCIVRRLSSGARACPVCNAATLPPLLPDVRLQRLVYLIVPGLYRSELDRRRHFRLVNPQCPVLETPVGAPDLTFDDLVSLSLGEIEPDEAEDDAKDDKPKIHSNYLLAKDKQNGTNDTLNENEEGDEEAKGKMRYLKCPAGVTVRHLVRLLMLKRGWNDSHKLISTIHKIEMLCETNDGEKSVQVLNPSWTLLDVACIFEWKREAPMKLLYRVVRQEDATPNPKSYCGSLDGESESQAMEDIQRPPTPPPSPKPISHINISCELKDNRSQTSSTMDHGKETETKKPRCEVTPVMRTSDPLESQEMVKPSKVAKVEHHKRRKRRNKRVIAEITTTPREDMLKLKVRLTPCPPRVTSSANSQTKEKLLQVQAVRRDKIKTKALHQQRSKTEICDKETEEKKDDSDEETIEQIIDSIPDEVIQIAQNLNNTFDEVSNEENNAAPKMTQSSQLQVHDKPKDEEVLRQLGLVNTQEMDREKLEKQLKESKANRVRSLLAEKQMRDTLESIKSMSIPKAKDTPIGSGAKKKGPPPLAPLRTSKTSGGISYTAISSFSPKCETPLDLSNGGSKGSALDLSSALSSAKHISSSTFSTSNSLSPSSSSPSSSVNKKLNVVAQSGTSLEKPQEERKSQDTNLRTLSNAAVSLLRSPEKMSDNRDVGTPNVSGKVALRIPHPHQRLSGFGMKMKPNLGIRHIPNPQAIVASQFRNQRTGFFNALHHPP